LDFRRREERGLRRTRKDAEEKPPDEPAVVREMGGDD
jgi:hypothetical protein